MGDIGSMELRFWWFALIGLLMIKTMKLNGFFSWWFTGVEVIFTILGKTETLKEKYFLRTHRRHLYQVICQ